MSIGIMAIVWDAPLDSHTEKLVLLALADNANDMGVCWPSVRTIAKKCSLSERGVSKVIAKLEAKGLLHILRDGGRSNRYTLVFPTNGWRKTPERGSVFTPEPCSPPNVVRSERGSPTPERGSVFTPEPCSPPNVVRSERGSPTPERGSVFTPERGSGTPERGSDEPSITVRKEPSMKPLGSPASSATTPAFAEISESEILTAEGRYLDALARRVALTPEQIEAIVAAKHPPTGAFDAWLRNRAAEDWTTPRGKRPIGFANWSADLDRFLASWDAKREPETPTAPKPKRIAEPVGWQAVYREIDPNPLEVDGEYCAPEWERLSPSEQSEVAAKMAAFGSGSTLDASETPGKVDTAGAGLRRASVETGAKQKQ